MKQTTTYITVICVIVTIIMSLSGCAGKKNDIEYPPNTLLYDVSKEGYEIVGSFIVSKEKLKNKYEDNDLYTTTHYAATECMVVRYMGKEFENKLRNEKKEYFDCYVEGVTFGEESYVRLPKGTTAVLAGAFKGEESVKYIDFMRSKYIYIQDGAFDGLPNLEQFIGLAKSFSKEKEKVAPILNKKYNLDLECDSSDIAKYPKLKCELFFQKHPIIAGILIILLWITVLSAINFLIELLWINDKKRAIISLLISVSILALNFFLTGTLFLNGRIFSWLINIAIFVLNAFISG